MLKITRTYIDYDENERTEDFYFNLSKAELAEMELSEAGGLSKTIEKIIAEQDQKKIIEYFKSIILDSYGEKSPDGKRFIKSQELKEAFSQTEAYSDLFMELSSDAKTAINFVSNIIPKEYRDKNDVIMDHAKNN